MVIQVKEARVVKGINIEIEVKKVREGKSGNSCKGGKSGNSCKGLS